MSTIDLGRLWNGASGAARTFRDFPLRMVLVQGEALRVPQRFVGLRVLSGTAWVTQAGKDHCLAAGESLSMAGRDDAVLSALGAVPLMVEVR